jgi:hypothetical protein
MQVERGHRLAGVEALVALDVVADQADPFAQGAADDGTAEGPFVRLGPPRFLGPQHELIVLAQDHQRPVRLRKELLHLVEDLIEELVDVEGSCQMLGDFQHHLQLGGGVRPKQPRLRELDGLAHHQVRLGAELDGRHAQRKNIRSDLQRVALGEGRRLERCEALAVEVSAVAAVEVFDDVGAVLADNARVVTAHGAAGETDRRIVLPAENGLVAIERKGATELGPLKGDQNPHGSFVTQSRRGCQRIDDGGTPRFVIRRHAPNLGGRCANPEACRRTLVSERQALLPRKWMASPIASADRRPPLAGGRSPLSAGTRVRRRSRCASRAAAGCRSRSRCEW